MTLWKQWIWGAVQASGLAAALVALGLAATATSAPLTNTLQASPGQMSVRGSSVTMMRSNGETGTFQCTCNKGQGSCSLVRMPSGLICGGASGDTCNGECVFFTTTTGLSGAAIAHGAAATSVAPRAAH